jgi:hypothetical protein
MTFVDAVLAQLSNAFFPSSESRMKEIERFHRLHGFHSEPETTGVHEVRVPDSEREESHSTLQRRRSNSDEDYIAPLEDTLATGGSRVVGGETMRVISTDDLVYDDINANDSTYNALGANDSTNSWQHKRRGICKQLTIFNNKINTTHYI